MKGIIGIRVEDTAGFSIEGNSISNIVNLSLRPFSMCDSYHVGASSENPEECQGANVRAISVAAVRGFDHRPSQIRGNDISGVSSDHANVIIGIDVQGDSKDVTIARNIVDLKQSIFHENPDKYISARVREAAGSSITFRRNVFVEETQILNSVSIRGRSRELSSVHPHISGDIEWKAGGCPFASDYAKR